MSTATSELELNVLGTTTHTTGDSMTETVIVTAPAEQIGTESQKPPNPYEPHFSHEMRCTYHHRGRRVGVQFPRWSNEYRTFDDKTPLRAVSTGDDDTTITALYEGEETVLEVAWDILKDEWDWAVNDGVENYRETIPSTAQVIWEER